MDDNRKQGKIIQYKLADDEGEEALYSLTMRMARGLIASVEYYRWVNRHSIIPSDLLPPEKLENWASNLELRLMKEVNPLDNVCAAIINCINTDDDVKDAFRDFIKNDPIINQYFDNRYFGGGGIPFPTTETLVENHNNDELWAQCVQVVEYTHEAISQLLDVLETQTNNIELLANSLNSIPFFKFLNDAIPVTSWVETADYFFSVVSEQYASGWSETVGDPMGTKWLIACEIFCLAKIDGIITTEIIWDAIASLLQPYTVISWDNASELIETIVGTNDNSQIVVYATFGLMWGVAKLSSYFGLHSITNSVLHLVLELAKNDDNGDWRIICAECNNEPRIPVIQSNWDPAGSVGVLSGPDEDGFYTVTAEPYGSGINVALMDEEERDFILIGIEYTPATPLCQVFLKDDVILNISCDGINKYTGQIIDEWVSSWNVGSAPASMKFKMVAP